MDCTNKKRSLILLSLILIFVTACNGSDSSSDGVARGSNQDNIDNIENPDIDENTLQRYALANGCYAIQSVDNGKFIDLEPTTMDEAHYQATQNEIRDAEPFYFKPTALGQYLLYDTSEKVLSSLNESSSNESSNIETTPLPSINATSEWVITSSTDNFTLTNAGNNRTLTLNNDNQLITSSDTSSNFQFHATEGCAQFPESEVNATGSVLIDGDSTSPVWGIADSHIHITAYEFIGGKINHGEPFHRFGITHALDDCMPIHGPYGTTAFMENILSYNTVFRTHQTQGYPNFVDWPRHGSVTHHQSYYKWIERTYKGGVRLLVNQLVANETLCELYPYRDYGCDEMESVDLQIQSLYALQDYIDAQEGGPGKGWFRIVTAPQDARREIKAGKMAVLMGIESSALFGCAKKSGQDGCTQESIDASIDKYVDLGVRSFFPIHEFDNALGGTALFGPSELFLNIGNKVNTGHYYEVEECPDEEYDHKQLSFFPQSDESPLKEILQFFGSIVNPILPTYDQSLPSHCNTRGIYPLGEYLIGRMMDKGIIIETDHMSAKMRNQVLTMAEIRGYSGLISGHSSSGGLTTTEQIIRLRDLGGLVYPLPRSAEIYSDDIRRITEIMSEGDYYVGVGFGSDINGFAHLPKPREGNEVNPVEYPFLSYDGRFNFDRQTTGNREFDVNVDGVAHYGLYPDFIEDMRQAGMTDEELAPLFQSAEAYLQMWERALASARR